MALIRTPPNVHLADAVSDASDFFRTMQRPEVAAAIRHANDAYLHWDQFRWRPLPDGVSRELVWAYMKLQRQINLKPVPLRDEKNHPFYYGLPDNVLRILSHIDRWSGETLRIDQPEGLPSRERYIVSSLMEEAIASSQLEGAATTRQVAKEMLLSGRKPRDHHEQMIYNNWITIQHLRSNTHMNLSPQSLCEIHAMVTEQTLKDAADAGRLRTHDEIVVSYRDEIVHTPPQAKLLPERMEALCRFANTDDEHTWMHPIVKASILHFWIGYDHPFVDGNGRTARALFYWYLLSRSYWIFEYLAISRYFLRVPGQYTRAYLYTETDERDLTYFIVHNLRVVRLSFQDLRHYLQRKQKELSDASELLRKYRGLNERQRGIIAHALRHPGAEYDIQSHKNVNSIAYDTARNDLLSLVQHGLMEKKLRGRTYVFVASNKIIDHLQQMQLTS